MENVFARADWYERGIDWPTRLGREIPVLTEVFGSPGEGGILDAGCGPGRHATALASRGYRVVAADADAGMIALAAANAQRAAVAVECVQSTYSALGSATRGLFDGIYCIGNSFAAAGNREACREALLNFAALLRDGGKLFVQVLNFAPLRREEPCVRGPRVSTADGVEYISLRHFTFDADGCRVTNLTVWKEDRWRQYSRSRRLFPVEPEDIRTWCAEAGLRLLGIYGSYARDEFDVERSDDLIFVATRESR